MPIERENGIKKAWSQVRTELGYPALREPVYGDTSSAGCDTAYIDLKDKRIVVNQEFVSAIRRDGDADGHADRLVLLHEVGHYRFHPYDALTVLMETSALLKLEPEGFDKQKRDSIQRLFDEVLDNSFLILSGKGAELAELYSRMIADGKAETSGSLGLTIAYYSEISGLDFGVTRQSLGKELRGKLDSMMEIDFLDRSRIRDNIVRFARLLKDVEEPQGGEGGEGVCGGMSLGSFSEDEVKKAIKGIAKEIGMDAFKKLAEEVSDQLGDPGNMFTDKSGSYSDTKASVEYYKALASRYPIKLLGARIAKADSTYPERLTEWQPGDSLRSVNPYRSFGLLIPGITKRWVYAPGEAHGQELAIPNSIVILDSSGSMINPSERTSPAVVGAFAVSMAYLRNGATVDVINFSSDSTVRRYSGDGMVFEELVRFKSGGTQPPAKELEGLVRSGNKDITVITDGFKGGSSSERASFMKLLQGIGETNRVSFINIGNIPEQIRGYNNIIFHTVTREQDIGKLILGDLRW